MNRFVVIVVRLIAAYTVGSYLVVPTWDLITFFVSPATVFSDRTWQMYAGAPWIWLHDTVESTEIALHLGIAAMLPLLAILLPLVFWSAGFFVLSKWALEPRVFRGLGLLRRGDCQER
jgi:hypothetical protein